MTDKQKTILFVGGGIETLPGVKQSKSMGLYVVVSDANPSAPCVKYADSFINADTYDYKKTLSLVKDFSKTKKIDGVICLASDVPLTVSIIANELNLQSIPIESAKITSDKILMKQSFKDAGINIPMFQEINNVNELINFIDFHKYPVVIKPIDSRGSRGVLRLTKNVDLDWAYQTSQSFSPSSRIMVEKFIPGPQFSTESIVVNSKVFTIGFSDRNYEFIEKYSPFIIENGGELPSQLNDDQKLLVNKIISDVANALNLNNCVIKGDIVFYNNLPYIIEVATRLSGGYFCTHEIPYNTGVDFVGSAIKLALKEEIKIPDLIPKYDKPVVQRYFIPNPGKVVNINIPQWIEKNKDIILFDIRVKNGDLIKEITNHSDRSGVVICTGNTLNDAKKLVKKITEEVLIETIPN